MSSSIPSLSRQMYQGSSEINFYLREDNSLSATVDTQRLHMRSVTATNEDYDAYASLFGDEVVMEKYATGHPKTKPEITARINDEWVKRWKVNDPYSGLAVFKNDTDEFVGHVMVEHGDAPGQAELAYLFMKNHWRRGYGQEAATALVSEYAPATIRAGYTLEGKVLEKIEATARPDNPGSVKILEKVGMHKIKEMEKFGTLRYLYSIDVHL